jgi:hypothetical protein
MRALAGSVDRHSRRLERQSRAGFCRKEAASIRDPAHIPSTRIPRTRDTVCPATAWRDSRHVPEPRAAERGRPRLRRLSVLAAPLVASRGTTRGRTLAVDDGARRRGDRAERRGRAGVVQEHVTPSASLVAGLPHLHVEHDDVRSEDLRRSAIGCRPRLKTTLFSVPALVPPAGEPIDDIGEELRQTRERLRRAERKLSAIEALDGVDSSRIRAAIEHVQMYCGPSGYVLAAADEPPPEKGDVVEVEHEPFLVARLAPSPFPEDLRRCAILIRPS